MKQRCAFNQSDLFGSIKRILSRASQSKKPLDFRIIFAVGQGDVSGVQRRCRRRGVQERRAGRRERSADQFGRIQLCVVQLARAIVVRAAGKNGGSLVMTSDGEIGVQFYMVSPCRVILRSLHQERRCHKADIRHHKRTALSAVAQFNDCAQGILPHRR
jgi:hypothetical protein